MLMCCVSQLREHATIDNDTTLFVMKQINVESRKKVRLKGCSVKEIRQGPQGENIAEVTMRVP